MAHVVQPLDQPSNYRDSQSRMDKQSQLDLLAKSNTLYVGNLSFYTTEEQIYELFSKCTSPEEGGGIKRIIMGLDRNTRTPCGFCFVEYYTHDEALACLRYISGTKLDERVVRCDLDAGYKEGRQFGRGRSGGQVRDEHRTDYDAGRGGWGAQAQRMEMERKYDTRYDAPVGAGEWKSTEVVGDGQLNGNSRKRERSPEDEEDREVRRKADEDDVAM